MSIFKQVNQIPENAKVINGASFIIPNSAYRLDQDGKGVTFIQPYFSEDRENEWGNSYNEKSHWVQMWTHNDKDSESNWECHGVENSADYGLEDSLVKTMFAGDHFPVYYPSEILMDKKEGDHLYLEVENKDKEKVYFDITLKQKGYRYEHAGNFEETLARVLV